MHRSIATVSLSGTLRQKLEAIAAAGFDGIELFENDFINFNGSAAELRAHRGRPRPVDRPVPAVPRLRGHARAQFRRSLERAERKFDLMQAMGAPLMLCCSNTSPLAIDDPDAARPRSCTNWPSAPRGAACASASRRWPGAARSIAVRPGLGHRAARRPSALGPDPRQLPHAVAAGRPGGHRRHPGEKIFFLQMADAPLLDMDVLQWARHHRSFPGQGEFDVDRLLRAGAARRLHRAAVAGDLQRRVPRDAEPPHRRRRDALAAYLESRRATGWRRPRPARDVAARRAVRPAAAAAARRRRFIEFAADAAAGAALGARCRAARLPRASAGTARRR